MIRQGIRPYGKHLAGGGRQGFVPFGVFGNDVIVTPPTEATSIVRTDEGASAEYAAHAGVGSSISLFSGTWWVLHTRARNEKAVAETLSRQGVSYFLPLVHYRRRYAGRVRQVEIPLFPGYLFLCGGPMERQLALRTNRVAQVLEVTDQERLRQDLRQIECVIQSNEPVDLFPRIMTGTRCRVTSGSLKGLEGIVLRKRGPWRVYVGVEFLGQSAELEIESSLLEVLNDDA